MRYREEPYRTPPGTLDAPFVYVYDASALTDGQTYQDVAKSIQGDSDFVLRVIRGLDTVLAAAPNGKFSYKNPNGSYCDGQYALGGQAASRGVVMPKNWTVSDCRAMLLLSAEMVALSDGLVEIAGNEKGIDLQQHEVGRERQAVIAQH